MTDPTKCVRCGAGPRCAIHHDAGLEDFHAFVRLEIAPDIAPRGFRPFLILVGSALVIVAAIALVRMLGG